MLFRCHVLILESRTQRYEYHKVSRTSTPGRQPAEAPAMGKSATIADLGRVMWRKNSARTNAPQAKGLSRRELSRSRSRRGWRLARMWFTKPFDVKAKRNCIARRRHWDGPHWRRDSRWDFRLSRKA